MVSGPLQEIAADVRDGHRTATEVVGEAIERAEASQDALNAFTTIDGDLALQRAEEIDRWVAAGAAPLPLTGVPIGLKDLIDHVGRITTCGSSFYRHQPDRSATVVEKLEAAGAVVIGRTGLHEFAYGFSSENDWFGPVRNPYDPSLSPGGSSGGSAAAVGAGVVPGAIGTDTGGSVRVPAALCGSVGLKVTHGRVSLAGVFPLCESLDTVGPLTTTVGDARALYDVMRGLDPADPWSIDPGTAAERRTGLEGLHVGIPTEWLESVPMTAATVANFDSFVEALRGTGVRVDPISAPALVPNHHITSLSAGEAAAVHRAWFPQLDKVYGREIEERLADAMEITLDEYLAARRWQAGVVAGTRAAFGEVDLLLTPSVGHPVKEIGVDRIDVNGKPTFYRFVLSCFTALVNQAWCPAISLPIDAPGEPPPSVQFIAPWWQESLLLDVGEHLEALGLVKYRPPLSSEQ